MISFEEYKTYCELLKYPNLVGLNDDECRSRDLARTIWRQRYADGIQDQQNLLRKQGLVETGTYPADMEARPYRYAAPAGTVMTDRGTIRPFFGCNVTVRSPNGEPIYSFCTWKEIQNGWDREEEDKIPQPIKAGIISIFSTDRGCESEIWIKCRDGEGLEFECPWEWAKLERECGRSEQ